jgi:hypothetical protein
MKTLFLFLAMSCLGTLVHAQAKGLAAGKPDPARKVQTVEAACGECQLGLDGKSCELAVRIEGKSYYVDGFKIDDFGDAHAKTGFCNAVRKAEVQGDIVDGRFKATYFKLLPAEKKK